MSDEPEPGPVEPDPVEVEIGEAIDLHVFAPRDIPAVVEGYLEAAHERGFREVRLIHGKGKGFQRKRVREILEACPFVTDYFDAPPGRGFWGATVARLLAPDETGPGRDPTGLGRDEPGGDQSGSES